MKTIDISVNNKIAKSPEDFIVCGNNDYKIRFAFDSEWNKHTTKTARFVWNGQYVDKIFEGDICDGVVITNAKLVAVGVFAGDLCTTTPALVTCKKSILCEGGTPVPPSDDVYAQLLSMYEETLRVAKDVETRANNGEFNGKDGKDGKNGKDGKDGDDYVLTEADKNEIANKSAMAIGNAMVDGYALEPFGQKHFYLGNPVSKNPTADVYVNPSQYTLREIDMYIENDAKDDRFFSVTKRTGLKRFEFYANYNANYIGLAFKLYGNFGYDIPVDAIYFDIGVKDNTDEFIRVYMSRGNECEVHIGEYSPPSERKDYFVSAHYSHNTDWSVVLDRKAIERYIGSTFDKMYIRGLFTVLASAYETETCFGFKGDAFVKKYHSALNDMFPHVLYFGTKENFN